MSAATRARDRLSPAEFTLLGLIALADSPDGKVHGYVLNQQLTKGATGEIIRLEPGMLYHYLKKLARRGLISSTVVPQEGKPDRHLHALTAAGRARFDGWMAEPVHATRDMRLDFLLKFWFASRIDANLAQELIQSQRNVLRNLITSLEGQLALKPVTSDEHRFARKVIELRLAQNRAASDWLDNLENSQ